MHADLSHPVHVHLRWVDKLVLLAALGLGAALFLSVGWMALAPEDPRGAVSLLTHNRPLAMLVQAMALAAVTSAVATAMIGPKLADVGVFAAALGMALASLRGGTAAYLLISVAEGGAGAERGLAMRLAVEGLAWFTVLVIAAWVSGWVMRWCYGQPADEAASRRVSAADMAVSELPILAGLTGFASEKARGGQWRSMLVTAVIAALVYLVAVSGSSPRAITHGQLCFAVFAAFYLGVWAAKRTFPARTPFWSMLAVALVSTSGYLWAMMSAGSSQPYAHLASVPASDFLRALPVTFVAVGTLGALAAHWSIEDAPWQAKAAAKSAPSTSKRRKRR